MSLEEERSDNNRFKPLFDEARYQLKYWEGQKQNTIRTLAEKLEAAGMPCEDICAEISNELYGYTTRRYVEQVLDDKYKRKPREVIKVSTGSQNIVREDDMRSSSHNDDNNLIEKTSPSSTTTASYDEEVKSLWSRRDGDNQSDSNSVYSTPNNVYRTELITQTEHDKIVRQLNQTISKLTADKAKDYTNTKEYQEQQQLIEFQKMRIAELEEIESKTIAEFSFQNASNMKPTVNLTEKVAVEIGFPANKLAKFFLDSRRCRKQMLLRHDGHNVTDWRVDE
jgi:hypothetical protein